MQILDIWRQSLSIRRQHHRGTARRDEAQQLTEQMLTEHVQPQGWPTSDNEAETTAGFNVRTVLLDPERTPAG
jgi:hypothetical protein